MTDSRDRKTLSEIQARIDSGEGIILTAREVGDLVRVGQVPRVNEIDVVTTATSALMSGTYAVLSFKMAEPDTFTTAKKVWLNSVPAKVGPCPNERIGILDLIVLGTAQSRDNPAYGGGHLFRDLVRGETVRVDIETDDGRLLQAATTLKEIPHAMLHASRNAFKNYLAFVNPGKEAVSTIFHADDMAGNYEEMTFCGCGEINPIENDPDLKTIGIGTRVLINGAPGIVTGAGTRSTAKKPNLTGTADMHLMKPEYMGGFSTGHGPDVVTTWAIAIPVLDRDMLGHILKTDDQIPLDVVDVRNRTAIRTITYGHVWQRPDQGIKHDPDGCRDCKGECCSVEKKCPAGAVRIDAEKRVIVDPDRCFQCGHCLAVCKGSGFVGELGSVDLEGMDRPVPITLRQSNRRAALQASDELKEQVLSGEFTLNLPVEKIKFPPTF